VPKNRGVSGRYLPGTSGNPNGRPKGLAALVQAETHGGAELVAFMLRVLRQEKQPTVLRMQAAQWLADRGFGKAVQQLEGSLVTTVDATVTHVEALRTHVREEDVDRLVAALLGSDGTP
jgi:Family of unknown function (DUF5681)